jgi:anti-anti-sigma factor
MATFLLSTPTPSRAPQGTGRIRRIEVTIDARPGQMVVRLAGEAGVRQVGELTAALLPLSACRPTLLILDLSKLTNLSSLAIGVLAEFCRGIVRKGGQVRLADTLHESVREALVRTELLALFDSPKGAERP